jgi:hypothetical protein
VQRLPGIELTVAASPYKHNASRVAWQSVGGQVLLVDLEKSRVLGLNPVASAIWPLLGECDIEALARVIATRFDVAAGEAAQDIRRFAEEMTRRGYLVVT